MWRGRGHWHYREGKEGLHLIEGHLHPGGREPNQVLLGAARPRDAVPPGDRHTLVAAWRPRAAAWRRGVAAWRRKVAGSGGVSVPAARQRVQIGRRPLEYLPQLCGVERQFGLVLAPLQRHRVARAPHGRRAAGRASGNQPTTASTSATWVAGWSLRVAGWMPYGCRLGA